VQRRGQGGGVPTWLVAVVAVAMVGGLLVWLAMTAEPSGSGMVVAEEAPDSAAMAAEQIPAVGLETFAGRESQYVGQDVRFTAAPVDSRLGARAFWIKLPNQGLFLVRKPADADAVAPNDVVAVAGPVLEMTDSVVTEWIQSGAITQDQELEARYATAYLDASFVRSVGTAPAAARDTAAAAR